MVRHLRKGRFALQLRRETALRNLNKRIPLIEQEIDRLTKVGKLTDMSILLKQVDGKHTRALGERQSLLQHGIA
jgi:hypothetical protein